MNRVKILTDSCADLTPELMQRYDIDYARMNTVFEGETSPALLSWTPEDVHAFYGLMRQGKRITTTQVPVDEFQRIFTQYLEEGYDIVYIACSSKQSGSVNTGHVVAEKLLEGYPDAQIHCIDSLNASMGEGVLAIEAAKMAVGGLTAAEIADKIMHMRKNVNEYCAGCSAPRRPCERVCRLFRQPDGGEADHPGRCRRRTGCL